MTNPTNFSFDLVDEPWIPCEPLQGARVELGIRDALLRAHELLTVHDESPLVSAVLHRLLLVVLDRAFAPETREDWVALWNAPRLPSEPIKAYLDKWRHRFDLFHGERPFMQVAGLEAQMTKDKGKAPERMPMWGVVMETSNYGGQVQLLAPHPGEARLTRLNPPSAARALLAFQSFTNGGRINNEAESWKGGLLRAAAVVLVRGSTLRETLLLNLVWRKKREAEDVPAWERSRDIQRLVRAPAGPTDVMLWPSRRMVLFPIQEADGQVQVEEALSGAGERSDEDVLDPQGTYFVRDPKKPPVALRFEPVKSPWRDSAPLFESSTTAQSQTSRRPAAIDQLGELVLAGLLPRSLRFSTELFGMSTDKANIRLWRREQLPLPRRLLTDGERVSTLRTGLALADAVGTDLERRVLFVLCERAIAPGEREAHKDDIQKLRDALHAGPDYWSELGLAFPAWLEALGDAEDAEEALPQWKALIRNAARHAFDAACARLGTSARALQAVAQAENTFRKMLYENELVPKKEPELTPTQEAGAAT